MRKSLLLVIGLFLLVTINSLAATEQYELIFGHMGTTDTAYHAVAEFMASRVAELTGGKVTIKVYPNAELGNEVDLF